MAITTGVDVNFLRLAATMPWRSICSSGLTVAIRCILHEWPFSENDRSFALLPAQTQRSALRSSDTNTTAAV